MSLEKPIWEQEPGEWPQADAVIIRHEEQTTLGKRKKTSGILRARRRVHVECATRRTSGIDRHGG
jgi:hypothetical protein